MPTSACEQPGLLVYVQIVSILMPIFTIGLAAAVVYMVSKLGASGMGRRVWKSNIRAIMEELEKERKQTRAVESQTPNPNLEIVSADNGVHAPKVEPAPQTTGLQPNAPVAT